MKYIIGIILAALIIVGGWGFMSYNGLVRSAEAVSSTWSTVQSQYQRRYDLVPNLVESVQGAADFEKDTFEAVAIARGKVTSVSVDPSKLDTESLASYEAAQNNFSSTLSRLLVVVEKYPDLMATENFLNLQSQLEGTENRIAVARRDFTLSVQGYNTRIKSFQGNILAGYSGFEEKGYFAAVEESAEAPKVDFGE